MALLKIRDKDGNIIEVPALKGDKYTLTENDKVEIANQVGSEFVHHSEVVDNLVVDGQPQWDKIPNGEALQAFIIGNAVSSAITQSLSDTKKARARRNIGALSYLEPDDKYDLPLSDGEKAQARNNIGAISHAELDEAIANLSGSSGDIAKPNWEHIATITVTPDADGSLPTKVVFSADNNNEAFALTSFYIFSYAGFTDADSTLYINVGNRGVITNCSNLKHTSLRYNSILYRQMPDGCIEVAVSQSGSGASKFNAQSPMGYQNIITPISENYEQYAEVKSITLYTGLGANKTWLDGSTFELYGVRK